MKFTKPPLTLDGQIALLKARGMAIQDEPKAKHHLAHLNYYRLRAYWMGMEGPKTSTGDHSFAAGADLNRALDLYAFDRSLRLLVMDAVEQLEVSVRTQWAYHFSNAHGAHAFLDPSKFLDPIEYSFGITELVKENKRSKETFIKHYRDNYNEPVLPPIWAMCEVMSLGQLSRWVSNLKHRTDRQAIADTYDMDEQFLCSFLGHLSYVRNLCAHHGRLWNRQFTITMRIPSKRPARALGWFNPQTTRQVYNTLAMLAIMLTAIEPSSDWPKRIRGLMDRFPNASAHAMGFPNNWKTFAIWAP